MNTLNYSEKSTLLIKETLESLRNKPVNSTFLERTRLTAEAVELFEFEEQNLRLGHALSYVLERASCPVEKHDILLGRFPESVPTEVEEEEFLRCCKTLKEKGFYTPDNGHTPLDWEELMRVGLGGYSAKCDKELQRRRGEGDEDKIKYLEGASLVYGAFSRYILRYADAAKDMGMTEAEKNCRNVACRPPENFAEALQLVLMVANIYSVYCVEGNATLCCGRMDDYLLPFYLRDLQSGKLTRETAGYLIDDFNCKVSLTVGRGEHQIQGGNNTGWHRNPAYDSPLYVIIGGYSNHGDHRDNPLSRLFIERINPRFENPVYVFRRTKDTKKELFRLVCDKMRANSTIILYNDETEIPAFEFAGVSHEDAVNYTIHGCNWPDIQGLNTYRVLHLPLPMLIMDSLFDENGDVRRNFSSMDEVYGAVAERFRKIAADKYRECLTEREDRGFKYSLRVSDLFKRGILEEACSGYCSAKYPFVHNRLVYIGTAADMLAAVEELVFGGKVSLQRLAEALKANFNGYEDVLKLCLSAPKYGHDDDRADRHAVRLLTSLTDIAREESFDKKSGERKIYATAVMITDMFYRGEGELHGATPDGRRAEAPFSENLSPTRGQSHAVTSLLNSVSKLPFERIASGALNIKLTPSMIADEDGLFRLTALAETYFLRGGMQLQLSVADSETLRAAQQDPDSYRDIMVRITGYSAVFVDMCKYAQDEIIARDKLT